MIDSEYEIPAPLTLQSLVITSVARVRRSGWSSDSVIEGVTVCTKLLAITAVLEPLRGSWLTLLIEHDGLNQLKPVLSVGCLHRCQTTLATWLVKSLVRETEQEKMATVT